MWRKRGQCKSHKTGKGTFERDRQLGVNRWKRIGNSFLAFYDPRSVVIKPVTNDRLIRIIKCYNERKSFLLA